MIGESALRKGERRRAWGIKRGECVENRRKRRVGDDRGECVENRREGEHGK